jgi:hypothetical protein
MVVLEFLFLSLRQRLTLLKREPRVTFQITITQHAAHVVGSRENKMTKIQIIYINCWKCGIPMSLPEKDYYHGASCGKC